MRTYKPMCPECGGTNTIIRSSTRHNTMLQTLYCDCLSEDCYTRFKVQSETVGILSTLSKKSPEQNNTNQIPLKLA